MSRNSSWADLRFYRGIIDVPNIHLFLARTHPANKRSFVEHSVDHIPFSVHPVVNEDFLVMKPSGFSLLKEDWSFFVAYRAWHFQVRLSILGTPQEREFYVRQGALSPRGTEREGIS
jgi:hypothetical protein